MSLAQSHTNKTPALFILRVSILQDALNFFHPMKAVTSFPKYGREQTAARRLFLPIVCLLLAAALCAGCASQSETKRPTVYRGGQFYGHALHSQDLASQ